MQLERAHLFPCNVVFHGRREGNDTSSYAEETKGDKNVIHDQKNSVPTPQVQ